jgi:Heparinase II/III-like protein
MPAAQHSRGCITCRVIRAVLLALLTLIIMQDQRSGARAHERPYFMPPVERDRLHGLILKEGWAKEDYARLKSAASTGDGFAAAFLYALDGDPRNASIAQQWLLGKYGKNAHWTVQAAERLKGEFFKGGQVGIPEVYYDTDISGYLAFDWANKGLEPTARREIEEGIVLWSRYKMRAMDRWTQTANLVFKPTSTVALSGLATDNRELIEWGFRRTKPWGARLGGYDVVLDTMLKDGGPWHEAPIYPIAHEGLLMISRLSRWRGLYDQKDWFGAPFANGGSGRGLMDYYIDSAYPIERTGYGAGQIRVANYGDGSTNAMGDLVLVNPPAESGNIVMHEPLIAAYNASRDPRYGAFVSMIPGYTPNLIDHPPLPAKIQLPPAPSKVWPTYGLAMLRSDESPNYWTSGKAIAVFQIMSKGYGHDHRDKFSISLHGAGRLFYPNYNALQYENPSVGWTRNSVSHNTLIVDEGETRNAEVTALRHEFSPEVKFLVSSADGVFEGVDQTRALLLTKEYLLDLVHANSPVPHTYDYVLHSFGRAESEKSDAFEPTKALMKRYWLLDNQKAMTTSEPWMLDFVIEEKPSARSGNYGREWYEHKARLRLRMAGEPQTLVVHGVWGNELARLVSEQQKDAKLDQLATVVARRAGRDALFVASHEPYSGTDQPQVTRVVTLGRTKGAAVIRVDAKDFTDYAAIALGPQPEGAEHTLLVPGERRYFFAFKNYGYARIKKDGSVTLRGGWTGLSLPEANGPVTLNGEAARATTKEGVLLLGRAPLTALDNRSEAHVPEVPMTVKTTPAVVRVSARDRRSVTFTLDNPLAEPVSGSLQFDLPAGLAVEPKRALFAPIQPKFGPIQPKASATVGLTVVSSNLAAGRHTVPYRFSYRVGNNGKEIRTAAQPLTVMTGPTLQHVYEYPRPYYLIHSPGYTVRADMFNGLHRFLADDDDTVRLNGTPLFTFSDGSTELMSEKTSRAFTWPEESPASISAHAEDRVRWQALYFNDRILIRMDPGWTQFEKAYFSVPGNWLSPERPPRWKRIVALDGYGKEVDAQPGAKVKVVAAELEFPGAKWSLAFKFEPAQEVAFNGAALKFAIGSLTNDNWQVGFCRPGDLESWRTR